MPSDMPRPMRCQVAGDSGAWQARTRPPVFQATARAMTGP